MNDKNIFLVSQLKRTTWGHTNY